MKLKYYMRGLGIGIILTTLILTIGGTKDELSDEEIMLKATSLGMVMKEENNPDLEKLLNEIKPSTNPTGKPTEAAESEDGTAESMEEVPGTEDGPAESVEEVPGTEDGTAESVGEVPGTEDGTAESAEEVPGTEDGTEESAGEVPGTEDGTEEASGSTEAPAQTDMTTGIGTEESTEITFTIEKGMSSGKVAALLVEKGLVQDADEFNRYMVDNGKASVIRIGTYSLPQGASYAEIVAEIASNK